MKATFRRGGLTSFHNDIIVTTPQRLINLALELGAPFSSHNDGDDKTNFDFEFETESGVYFTVYDWKEYEILDLDCEYEFHIGHSGGTLQGMDITEELEEALSEQDNDIS